MCERLRVIAMADALAERNAKEPDSLHRDASLALRLIAALERENERLREALERIAGMRLNFLAQEIAREALEPVEGVPAQEGSE